MNKVLKLVSPMPPSVNHYLAYRCIYNKKTKKWMAMSYKTADATKYQKDFTKYVIEEVKKQGWKISENKYQHYYFDVVFYFPRIDMDANNYFKCCLDSITESELVWIDDNQVCERVNRVFYDSKNPRMEIEIKPVDYIGVFDNTFQLEYFESNCIGCMKYKRNCSLLIKAKEGRIQEDICDLVCSKFKPVKQ